MPIRNTWKSGDWLYQCQVCGRTFYASQIRQRWDGLRVCSDDYEPRHPQEFVRGKRDDQTVPFANPPADSPHFLTANEVTRDSL